MRNQEATVRPWETQWKHVTHGETVRVERSDIKMSKNLSAKYYQENKERLQKKAREGYQNLSKEEKTTIWLWTF